MGSGRTAVGWLIVAMGSVSVAGCQASLFTCQTDANCEGLAGGACESNGFCSVPADDCPSGRRYADHSGVVSGACVDTSGSTGVSGTSTGAPDLSTTSGPGDPTGTTESGGTLSLAESGDADTGTTAGLTQGTTGFGTSTGATGGPPATPCGDGTVVYLEEFVFGELPPDIWTTDSAGAGAADVRFDRGELTVSVQTTGSSGLWWAEASLPVPDRGAFVFEMIEPPPEGSNGVAWVVADAGPREAYLEYRVGTVVAVRRVSADALEVVDSMPYDPQAHRWARVVYDKEAQTIEAQLADAAFDWQPFYSFDTTDYDFDGLFMGIGGGALGGETFEGDVFTIDNLVICDLQ